MSGKGVEPLFTRLARLEERAQEVRVAEPGKLNLGPAGGHCRTARCGGPEEEGCPISDSLAMMAEKLAVLPQLSFPWLP